MKRFLPLACVLLLMMALSVRCGEGETPETIVVPSGDPADVLGGDPFDGGGDFDCGGMEAKDGSVSLDPVDLGEDGTRVLVTLVGTKDVYMFLVDENELTAVAADLVPLLVRYELRVVDREQIDDLQSQYCGQDDGSNSLGEDLRALLTDALGADRLHVLSGGVCNS